MNFAFPQPIVLSGSLSFNSSLFIELGATNKTIEEQSAIQLSIFP